jgi:hypothetical protein
MKIRKFFSRINKSAVQSEDGNKLSCRVNGVNGGTQSPAAGGARTKMKPGSEGHAAVS